MKGGTVAVGVIGLGRAGIKHAQVYHRMPGVALAAVCDLDAVRAREAGERFGCRVFADYRDLLRDPAVDAVSIVLPDDSHLEASRAAAEAGKHILVEKPLASTLADACAICRVADGYGRTFMVGHTLRFDPRHTMARDRILAGEIGDLIHVSSRRNSTIAGAALYRGHTDTHIHLMVHDADYVNWIAGARPRTVFARSREVLLGSWGMHDTVIALVSYDSGLLVCIEACWVLPAASPTGLDDKMEIVGTRGVLYLDSCDAGLHVVAEGKVDFPDTIHWPEINGETGGTFYEELSHFVRCIVTGSRPIVGPREALPAVEVVDAIERSLRERREVSIGVDPCAT